MLIDLESLLLGGIEAITLDESFDFSKEALDGVDIVHTILR